MTTSDLSDHPFAELTTPELKAQLAQLNATITLLKAQRNDIPARIREKYETADPTQCGDGDGNDTVEVAIADAKAIVNQEINTAEACVAQLKSDLASRKVDEAAAEGTFSAATVRLLASSKNGFGIVQYDDLVASYLNNRHRFPGAPKLKDIAELTQVFALYAIAEGIAPVMTATGPETNPECSTETFAQLCARLSTKEMIPEPLLLAMRHWHPSKPKLHARFLLVQWLGLMRMVPDGIRTFADLAPERIEVASDFADAMRIACQQAGVEFLDPAQRPESAPASYGIFVHDWYTKLNHDDTANMFVGGWYQKTDESNTQSLWSNMFGSTLSRDKQQEWTKLLSTSSPSVAEFNDLKGSSPLGTILTGTDRDYFDATLGFFIKYINAHDLTMNMEGKVDDTSVFQVGRSLPMIYGLGYDAVRKYYTRLGVMMNGVDYLADTTHTTTDMIDQDAIKARREFGVAFGVYRMDWCAALACCAKTGVFPKFMAGLLYLHLGKYVRIDESGGKLRLRITYRDRDSTLDVALPDASLSTGVKQDSGNGRVREALLDHLGLRLPEPDDDETPAWYQDAKDLIDCMLHSVCPKDFPQAQPAHHNPLLITPPAVVLESFRDRTEKGLARTSWLNVQVACRGYLLYDLSTHTVNPGYTNAAATIHLIRLGGQFSEATHADFIASLPEKVTDELPSSMARRYAPNRNDLGEPVGCDIAHDAILLSDLIRTFYPHTMVGKLLAKEILLVLALPADVSDADLTSNIGKSKHLFPLAKACCPALKITPPPDGGNAVAQRTLIFNFLREKAFTFFLDDFVWPKGQGHFLHETKIRVIATTGIGQSPGMAYENGTSLNFLHHLFMTLKTVPAIPDIRNRLIAFFYDAFSNTNRLSNEDITVIEGDAYPWLQRLAALRLLFTPAVQEMLPTLQAVDGPLRFKGISAIVKMVCEVTGRPYEAFTRYLTLSSAKLDELDVAGDESGVSSLQGDSVRAFLPFFERANASLLSCLATKMVDADANRGLAKLDIVKAIVANEGEYWQVARQAGIENDGHANRIAGSMAKAAKANQMERPDGWSLISRKVHLASGNQKDRVYLVHETDSKGEFSITNWEQRFTAWRKAARPPKGT